jgi:hypothetical protein
MKSSVPNAPGSATIPDQQKEARMQDQGGGGVAFVSVGLPELVLALVILGAVAFGVWKLAKILWAAFSG